MATSKVKPVRKQFVLAKMRDQIGIAAEMLTDEIRQQNPDVDSDAMEDDIRSVVKQHGTGQFEAKESDNPNPAVTQDGTPTIAGIERPAYSFAADILCVAFEAFQRKDFASSLKLVSSAMESDDAPQLMQALAEMNAQSETGVLADAQEDNEEADANNETDEHLDDDPGSMDAAMEEQIAALSRDDEDDDNAADLVDGNPDLDDDSEDDDSSVPDDDDDSDSDPLEGDPDPTDEDNEPFGRDPVMSGLDLEKSFQENEDEADGAEDPTIPNDVKRQDENEEEPEDQDDSQPGVPMGGTSSSKTTANAKVSDLFAIANKVSLSGMPDKRREAAAIIQAGTQALKTRRRA